MTLIAIWIRRNSTLEELVIAADSRISGGESWDSCPKIVPLPHPGTAMIMSGDAEEAYAFLIHAINTCHLLDGHIAGRTDIRYLARELKRVYNDNREHVTDLPIGDRKHTPKIKVALAGWSWRRSRFELYTFQYSPEGSLSMTEVKTISTELGFRCTFMGDAEKEANAELRILLSRGQSAGLLPLPMRGHPFEESMQRRMYFDWEPLEVLLKLIASKTARTVGGAPQVARIYQNIQVEQFIWRDDAGRLSFGGRPLLSDERSERRILSATKKADGLRVSPEFTDLSIQATHAAAQNAKN